jgi:hypothetical protein
MHIQRTTSGAAGNGLYTTIKYMRGAAGIGLGATMKYLRRTTGAAANNFQSTTIIRPCSAATFKVNSESHTGACPSVRLCVGPEFSRCVHHKAGLGVARGDDFDVNSLVDKVRLADVRLVSAAAISLPCVAWHELTHQKAALFVAVGDTRDF